MRIPYGLDDRDYIQGTVTLMDNGPHTGGNLVFPKSHKYFRHIAETYHRPMKDEHGYINSGSSLPAAMRAEPSLFGAPIMAALKAGDVFVWDVSRSPCRCPAAAATAWAPVHHRVIGAAAEPPLTPAAAAGPNDPRHLLRQVCAAHRRRRAPAALAGRCPRHDVAEAAGDG